MTNEFKDFAGRLLTMLDVELPAKLTRDADLYADLGLDSLQAFQLVLLIESLTGVVVPPETVPALYSLGDAFDYYAMLSAAGSSDAV